MDDRLLIIGDVHGMLDALRQLVDELDIQPSDTLVFVRDLIDKGPDSIGVLRYVEALRRHASFEVVLVEGNHEDRMRRYLRNRKLRPNVATEQAVRAPELALLHKQLDAERLAFLDGSVPFFHYKPLDVLVVHGGIPGTMSTFPSSIDEARRLTGRAAKRFEKIFRTRYVDAASGEFLALGAQRPEDPFWAETYDGRFGHVVFGHQLFLERPAEFPYATGIDTGAVHGGGLTALVWAPDAPRRFLTVQSDCFIPYTGMY
ncbi:putative phosphatase [Methylophaga frappieri]|jgi:diadenosine tetraphosphatase ApaH/serine/threonine PP2A family protein phosphatase|uniref:Putative phosphatase n=1 Tax=Methylophaga frappieri (strain ATCC BAA-2434 / DSM 25690 / JAM7) TaxID=754477 RepID=I1YIH2_METFJ|nr:metallophosphoesterase [Methylophaga frappieri]AFJ02715.1 putative phosphatase [Methylophaga frappieri]